MDDLSTRIAYAKNWLQKQGYAPSAAAGIVGNLAAESSLVPQWGDNGTSYGYAQWHNERRQNFFNWAAQRGLAPTSADANLGFLHHELQAMPALVAQLNQASNPQQAAELFGMKYERPKGSETGDPRQMMGYMARVAHANRAAGLDPSQFQFAAASPAANPEAPASAPSPQAPPPSPLSTAFSNAMAAMQPPPQAAVLPRKPIVFSNLVTGNVG